MKSKFASRAGALARPASRPGRGCSSPGRRACGSATGGPARATTTCAGSPRARAASTRGSTPWRRPSAHRRSPYTSATGNCSPRDGGIGNLVRYHIYQRDKRFFPVFDRVRRHHEKAPPASTAVGVGRFDPDDEARLCIDAIAFRPSAMPAWGARTVLGGSARHAAAAHFSHVIGAGPYLFIAGQIPDRHLAARRAADPRLRRRARGGAIPERRAQPRGCAQRPDRGADLVHLRSHPPASRGRRVLAGPGAESRRLPAGHARLPDLPSRARALLPAGSARAHGGRGRRGRAQGHADRDRAHGRGRRARASRAGASTPRAGRRRRT